MITEASMTARILESIKNKRDGKYRLAFFVDEILLLRQFRLIEIDHDRKQLVWGQDVRDIPLINLAHEVYVSTSEHKAYAPIIYKAGDMFITTFFKNGEEAEKLRRKAVRVKCSDTNTVIISINKEPYVVYDISETGLSILVAEEKLSFFKPGKEIKGELIVGNYEGIVFFKPVRLEKRTNHYPFHKVGCQFTGITDATRKKIAEYIIKRQQELAKKLNSL